MRPFATSVALGLCAAGMSTSALAGSVTSITVDGTDAIYLAGRATPIISSPSILNGATAPDHIGVTAGQILQITDPSGTIDFYAGSRNRTGADGYGGSSNVSGYNGISGYKGSQGALVGVFLSDTTPSGGLVPNDAAALDMSSIGVDFLSLSPSLNQTFFIGDGKTATGALQSFVAPTGATRLYFGLADAGNFSGTPNYYYDNIDSTSVPDTYVFNVGVASATVVPAPAAAGVGMLGLVGGLMRRRRAN